MTAIKDESTYYENPLNKFSLERICKYRRRYAERVKGKYLQKRGKPTAGGSCQLPQLRSYQVPTYYYFWHAAYFVTLLKLLTYIHGKGTSCSHSSYDLGTYDAR